MSNISQNVYFDKINYKFDSWRRLLDEQGKVLLPLKMKPKISAAHAALLKSILL